MNGQMDGKGGLRYDGRKKSKNEVKMDDMQKARKKERMIRLEERKKYVDDEGRWEGRKEGRRVANKERKTVEGRQVVKINR